MATLAKEYDIVLIQEHHKTRAKDMTTGPYVIAGFAPAQRTTLKPNGKDWYTPGGCHIGARQPVFRKGQIRPTILPKLGSGENTVKKIVTSTKEQGQLTQYYHKLYQTW